MQENFSYVPRAAVSKFIKLCDICSLHRPKNSSVLKPLAQYKHCNRETISELTQSKSSVKTGQKEEEDVVEGGGQKADDGYAEFPDIPSTLCSEVTGVSTSTMEKQKASKDISSNKKNKDDKSSSGAS